MLRGWLNNVINVYCYYISACLIYNQVLQGFPATCIFERLIEITNKTVRYLAKISFLVITLTIFLSNCTLNIKNDIALFEETYFYNCNLFIEDVLKIPKTKQSKMTFIFKGKFNFQFIFFFSSLLKMTQMSSGGNLIK